MESHGFSCEGSILGPVGQLAMLSRRWADRMAEGDAEESSSADEGPPFWSETPGVCVEQTWAALQPAHLPEPALGVDLGPIGDAGLASSASGAAPASGVDPGPPKGPRPRELRKAETAAAVELGKEWKFPRAAKDAGQGPRYIRKFAKNIPAMVKGCMLYKADARKALEDAKWGTSAQTWASAAASFDFWLYERGLGDLQKVPLQSFWDKDSTVELPKNLQGLTLPPRPPPADDWEYYDLGFPPPDKRPPLASGVDPGPWRIVPQWEAGKWCLRWHGTSMYGISSATGFGMLFPSEKGRRGNCVSCGRGVYSSETFYMATRYAVPHALDQKNNKYWTKAVLLVAIPGSADLPLARWVENPGAKKGKRYKLVDCETGEDITDDRLDRKKIRMSDQSQSFGEPDWTNAAPDADQESSSRAYPLGIAVAHMLTDDLKKYGYEGGSAYCLKGWNETAEPAPCRAGTRLAMDPVAHAKEKAEKKKQLNLKRRERYDARHPDREEVEATQGQQGKPVLPAKGKGGEGSRGLGCRPGAKGAEAGKPGKQRKSGPRD